MVALVAAVGMWWLAGATSALAFDFPGRLPLALLVAACGLTVDVSALLAFRRARTTVDPLRPHKTATLVTTGIYRRTRNPMYLGLALLLAAYAVHLGAPLAVLGPIAFVAYITRFQIAPEERMLAQKFGEDYAHYRARVRRWL